MRSRCPEFALALLFCVNSFIGADIHIAASCSRSDVASACAAAAAGDIVSVPAGTATWLSPVVIDKSITLQGAGIDSTRITGSGASDCLSINLSSDQPVRITGFNFRYSTNNTGGHAIMINGRTDGSYGLTQIRIDHNKFEKGTRTIYASGWVEGVIDSNQFLNCNIAVGITGDNNHSWSRPIEAGTSHSLFIEDNIFTIDNYADREPNHLIYHQEGGRTTIRFNLFDGTTYTNGNSIFYDSHGNQNYYQGSMDFRAQPIVELYGNQFRAHHTYAMMEIRGGSNIMYDNTLVTLTGSAPYIPLWEEEAWQTSFFSPLSTVWNAEDQIMNSFFWNNTSNGSQITQVYIPRAPELVFIQENRDYFMHAPSATGGKAVYIGRQGGAESFSASGPNAYFPYTPFVYPHPLRAGTFAPDAPQKLRIKQ